MSQIGNFIRTQRLARNYSLEELSDGIMTKAFLSKFERGLSDISSNKLIMLLDRLNVSLHEMNNYLTNSQNTNQINFLTEYSYARKDNNKFLLKKLLEKEQNLYNKFNNVRHLHNTLIITQKLNQLNNIPFNINKTKIITEYLHNINEWYYYEVALFSNSLFFLPFNEVELFSKNIIERTNHLSKNKAYQQEVILLVSNIISNFIRQNKITLALDTINLLETYITYPTFYYEIIKLQFLKGICFIKNNNKSEGIKLTKESLNFMYELNDYSNLRIYQDYLDNVLENLD